MKITALPVLAFACLVAWGAGPGLAQASHEIQVQQPWARASLGAVKTGVVYLTIENGGHDADQLVAVDSPVAASAALHSTTMDQGVMKMRPLEALEVAPGEAVTLEPGGLHVMLMGLKAPLEEGTQFPLTLTFAEAGPVQVTVAVNGATASEAAPMDHGDHAQMDHGDHAQASEEAGEHGKHHGAVEMTAEEGPSLRLQVVSDPEAGWVLTLATENFEFNKDHVDQPHQDGEGHAHLYVDGEKITRVYDQTYTIESLPEGSHEIRVTLNANDHQHYEVAGHQVAAEITVEAGANEKPESKHHIVDLRIQDRKVLGPDTLRVTEGEQVRMEWSSSETTKLHLHGYDIETVIEQGDPTITSFEAHTAGRFPVTSHGFGDHDHGHHTMLYLEVLPD